MHGEQRATEIASPLRKKLLVAILHIRKKLLVIEWACMWWKHPLQDQDRKTRGIGPSVALGDTFGKAFSTIQKIQAFFGRTAFHGDDMVRS